MFFVPAVVELRGRRLDHPEEREDLAAWASHVSVEAFWYAWPATGRDEYWVCRQAHTAPIETVRALKRQLDVGIARHDQIRRDELGVD